jgi:hypothetical protein
MFLVHEIVLDARFLSESTVKLAVIVAFDPTVFFGVAMPLVDDKVVREDEESVTSEEELKEASCFVCSVP